MSIAPNSFTYLAGFLRRNIGLALDESKLYLIRTRLLPLARKHNFETLDLLVEAVRRNENSPLSKEVLDSMTTNETLFFRDRYPFDALEKVIFPQLQQQRGFSGRIKVWSAAASTGQEAYSIAMTASKSMPQADRIVSIVGTDISSAAIATARAGVYRQMEIQRGLPIQELIRYFTQVDEHTWKVCDSMQSMVKFQEANLISPSLVTGLRHYSMFDVVFCRNVLIYFDVEQRRQVIDHIAQLTEIGGYLFTGTGEMVEGHKSKWEVERIESRPVWRLKSRA